MTSQEMRKEFYDISSLSPLTHTKKKEEKTNFFIRKKPFSHVLKKSLYSVFTFSRRVFFYNSFLQSSDAGLQTSLTRNLRPPPSTIKNPPDLQPSPIFNHLHHLVQHNSHQSVMHLIHLLQVFDEQSFNIDETPFHHTYSLCLFYNNTNLLLPQTFLTYLTKPTTIMHPSVTPSFPSTLNPSSSTTKQKKFRRTQPETVQYTSLKVHSTIHLSIQSKLVSPYDTSCNLQQPLASMPSFNTPYKLPQLLYEA